MLKVTLTLHNSGNNETYRKNEDWEGNSYALIHIRASGEQ